MKIIKKQSILASVLLVIFVASSGASFTNVNSLIDDSGLVYAGTETDSFVEDFTDQVYKDPSTTAWGWGGGTLTNTREFTWQILDYYNTTFPASSVDVQGRKAYFVQYDKFSAANSINCMDINDPSNIIVTSQRNSISGSLAIAVEGDVGYVGTNSDGFEFVAYNISKPYGFNGINVFLGGHDRDGIVTDLDIEGHLVYHTVFNSSSDRSFRVVNAEDPLLPVMYPATWSSSKALGIEVEAHLAYVAASTDGFYILNVSSKYSQVEIGYLSLPGNATDVILDGNYAYVALGEAGVALVDVSDPTAPQLRDIFDTLGSARKLVLQGNTLFVADGIGGIYVLDVVNHERISYVSRMMMANVWDVALYGGTLVVANIDGIYTISISAGNGITDFSTSYYVNRWDSLQVWDVRVFGDIAYIAGGPDGFYTLDVSNPDNPVLLDHVPLASGSFRRLDVKGTFAHLVTDLGYYQYNIQDPSNIQQVDFIAANSIMDVFVHGDLVYLTWQYGSYVVLNVSVPYVVNVVDEAFHSANVTSIWVQGPHVYTGIYGDTPGLYVHQKLDITNHILTDSYSTTGLYQDIKVDGDIAYSADSTWLPVHNVTDPYAVSFIKDVRVSGVYVKSLGVWNFGPYLLNAAGADGVYIIDATDLSISSNPGTNYAGATNAHQITSYGDYTYVANIDSLVILRHFESAGDTYVAGNVMAKSTNISSTIDIEVTKATLSVDRLNQPGCSADYYLTSDGGLHWDPVALNVEHTFNYPGDDLRWKVELTGQRDKSIHIYSLTVDYTFETTSGSPISITSSILAILFMTILFSAIYGPKKRNKLKE